jgi:hypothetical protein
VGRFCLLEGRNPRWPQGMSEKAFALLFRLSVLKVLPAGLGQEQGLRTLPLLPAAQMGPVWVKMGNLF